MKKSLFAALAVCFLSIVASAKSYITSPSGTSKNEYAEIKFDTLRVNLGTFSESEPEQQCSFVFTNVGNAPLVINQAFASCGCTVPTYTKNAIQPGEKGTIKVTYNGKGKFPGHFSKTVTIRSNAKNEIVRLTVEGTMTAVKK